MSASIMDNLHIRVPSLVLGYENVTINLIELNLI